VENLVFVSKLAIEINVVTIVYALAVTNLTNTELLKQSKRFIEFFFMWFNNLEFVRRRKVFSFATVLAMPHRKHGLVRVACCL
jgi:uncharacterized membrane protein